MLVSLKVCETKQYPRIRGMIGYFSQIFYHSCTVSVNIHVRPTDTVGYGKATTTEEMKRFCTRRVKRDDQKPPTLEDPH